MTTARPRKPQKRPVAKKRKPPVRRGREVVTVSVIRPHVSRARHARVSREVVGLRCRVVGVHPEAEVIVLKDFYGQQVLVPVTSAKKDGVLALDLAGLVNRDVWLSLRIP